MPIYDYVCEDCGDHFEYYQSFKTGPQAVSCPKGHSRTKRLFSVPSVVFKGPGFYVNDHRHKSQAKGEA